MTTVIYTLGVVVFIIGIIASIALHELGHLLPARFFGVKVTQYFVGFGRTLWSRRRGELEYGLKAIPLGGYVKLVGMLPPDDKHGPDAVPDTNTGLFTQLAADARQAEYEHVTEADRHRLFYRKPWWQKLIIMAGGPVVNVILAFTMFLIVFAGFGVPTPTTTVAAVADCAITDTEAGRACTDSDPVAPAKKAGLKPGDTITAFDGRAISDWDELSQLIRDNKDRTTTISYRRDGTEHTEDITTSVLARASLDDPDSTVKVGFLGVTAEVEQRRHGVGTVLSTMGQYTKATGDLIVHLPQRMVEVAKAAVGAQRQDDGPISVVGASRVAGELVTTGNPTWSERAISLLLLLASINLFLALFNLVPLLPMDGGHIAGTLWEAVRRGIARLRRKPDPGFVDVAKMLPIAYGVGLLLILMSVILIYADIVNPVKLS